MLAGGGIAREADAGAGVLAQVAEDHALHVNRCAEPVVDVIDAPIGLGALVLPAPEDGVAGRDQLHQRILRKILAGLFFHQLFILGDDFLERIGLELVVELDLCGGLHAIENVLELLLGNVEDHVAEHLDEAAVGVIGKAGIIAAPGERLDGLVVEAEVEDGVHHAGHGELGAGTDRDEQRIFARAELLALHLFQLLQRVEHLGLDLRAQFAAHVFAAGLGLNGEPGRNRKAGIGHLSQAGAFAAQNVLHFAVAIGFAAAEEIDILG